MSLLKSDLLLSGSPGSPFTLFTYHSIVCAGPNVYVGHVTGKCQMR